MVSENRVALKKRMERLNHLWKVLHDELLEMNPPTSAECPTWSLDYQDIEHSVIGFGKVRGKWSIYTCDYTFNPEHDTFESSNLRCIEECSAEERVTLVKFVPGLRKAVQDSLEKFLKRTDDAIAEFEAQLNLAGTMSAK